MEDLLFSEKQQFRQTWIIILLAVVAIVCLAPLTYAFYKQIMRGSPFGNNPMSDGLLIIVYMVLLAAIIGIYYLFWTMALITRVTIEGIFIQFKPFHIREKFINKESIGQASIRQYKPITEYGGWGIRYGRHGKAYNVSGNIGLQLVFTNGKKLLIGTQKPTELKIAIQKLGLIGESM